MRVCYPGSFDPPTTAHLAIARAAATAVGALHVDWVVSRVALAKEHVQVPHLDDRVRVLHEVANDHDWLGVVVTEAQLLVDVAAGYDALVMGADKWHQIHELGFYDGSAARRDAAIAALPRPLIVPRDDLHVPDEHVLSVDSTTDVSSTLARAGRHELMLPAARRFDRDTGAWTEPHRYRRDGSRAVEG
ncbi:MAG: hypothetical protein AAGA99_09555 [Actinomycetota bacterium]